MPRTTPPARALGALALLLAAPAGASDLLRVMSYNVLHGQPCGGGSRSDEVLPRMELAVQGGPGGEPGLVELAPDILGMQEVSQVFRDEAITDNQTCAVLGVLPAPIGGLPEGVDTVFAFQHQGSYLARRMNGVNHARGVETGTAGSRFPTEASPYAMRFERDNPRLLPLVPDVPLPPDEEAASDVAADIANLEIGLAVLTRLRIQFVSVHNLPPDGLQPGGTRALLHASLFDEANGRAYDFYDSHLTTTGGNSPATEAQAANIVQFIAANRRHPENPAFFVCDCNATPGTLAHLTFAGAGYEDSFAAANPGVDGFTSGRGGLSDDCNQSVGGRIDYVWSIPDDQGRLPAVVSSQVVMEYADEHAPGVCRFPSDHNGVLSTFDMSDLN